MPLYHGGPDDVACTTNHSPEDMYAMDMSLVVVGMTGKQSSLTFPMQCGQMLLLRTAENWGSGFTDEPMTEVGQLGPHNKFVSTLPTSASDSVSNTIQQCCNPQRALHYTRAVREV